MSAIKMQDLLQIHQDLTEVMKGIDESMMPGVERAIAWRKLCDSRNLIAAAIASAQPVHIQEAA